MSVRFELAALRLLHFAGAESLDQIGDVRQFLLEIALIALEPFEDVVTLVPAFAESAVVPSASVMHRHLPSQRSRNVSILSRDRASARAHSSRRRRPSAVSSYVRFAGPGAPASQRDVTRPS